MTDEDIKKLESGYMIPKPQSLADKVREGFGGWKSQRKGILQDFDFDMYMGLAGDWKDMPAGKAAEGCDMVFVSFKRQPDLDLPSSRSIAEELNPYLLQAVGVFIDPEYWIPCGVKEVDGEKRVFVALPTVTTDQDPELVESAVESQKRRREEEADDWKSWKETFDGFCKTQGDSLLKPIGPLKKKEKQQEKTEKED